MGLTQFISAYRIAHRLPGRIRIHIPVLQRLPADWRIYLKPAADLIRLKRGILSVEIQPITGNLLIRYDPDTLDEVRILKWLEALVADFLKTEGPSKSLNETHIHYRFRRLRNRLQRDGVLADIN